MINKCKRYNIIKNNINKLFNFYSLLTNLILLILLVDSCIGENSFGYTLEDQKLWRRINNTCSNGENQSPISINKNNIIKIKNSPKLIWLNYRSNLPGPLSIKNNGDTVTFNLPKNGKRPTITGSKLPGIYELHSFHFHWGHTNYVGSEHIINGKRYPLELHMVHTNVNYHKSFDESLQHKDGLVVIGILYKLSFLNIPLTNIIKYVNNVTNAGDEQIIKSPQFSMGSLFSSVDLKTYYLYNGSLTTPPCSEVVTWLIFPNHKPGVNDEQLKIFRKLKRPNGETISSNYRNVQKFNGRNIYYVPPKSKNSSGGRIVKSSSLSSSSSSYEMNSN